MDAAYLTQEIGKVCPVISCTVLEPDNRNTWSYLATQEATAPELAAADNVIATIPVKVPGKCSVGEFLTRFTNAEYRAADATAWRQTAGNAKNWDIVIREGLIHLTKRR